MTKYMCKINDLTIAFGSRQQNFKTPIQSVQESMKTAI